MRQIIKHTISSSAIISCSLLFFYQASAQAAEKAYLEAVEADVAEFYTKSFELSPDSPWVVSLAQDAASVAGQDGGLEEFSAFIKSKSPGSYIFYKKLPDSYKERLHQDYLATGDLDRIKDDIFRYTKEVRRSR